MEKIKKALDMAREKRQVGHTRASGNAVNVSEIKYTQTQSIASSNEVMRQSRILSVTDSDSYADAFKILSTQVLQRMKDHQWTTLAVTSPSGKEGTTITTINLGISIAKEFEYTVLVVDANLRIPNIHKHFGVKPQYGLSDYLKNGVELKDILFHPEGIEHFVILPGGEPLINSTEMLSSPKMCDLVKELKERYPKRIILFDLPPLLKTADAISFVPCLDAALIVVEDDVTREEDLRSAVDLLSVTNIVGTVLNKSMY